MLPETLTTCFGTACPQLLPAVKKVVEGFLQNTGTLKCRSSLNMILVFYLFGGASNIKSTKLVVMFIPVLVVFVWVMNLPQLLTELLVPGNRMTVVNMLGANLNPPQLFIIIRTFRGTTWARTMVSAEVNMPLLMNIAPVLVPIRVWSCELRNTAIVLVVVAVLLSSE